MQGRTTPKASKEDETLDYFDKSEAEYGRQTPKEQRAATAQMQFDNEKAYAGKTGNYVRNQEMEQEFIPPAVEDDSGKSVSGESEVANHAPFNALQDFIKPKDTLPQFTPKPTFKEDFKPMPNYRQES